MFLSVGDGCKHFQSAEIFQLKKTNNIIHFSSVDPPLQNLWLIFIGGGSIQAPQAKHVIDHTYCIREDVVINGSYG